MTDHNSETPELISLKLSLENLEEPQKLLVWFINTELSGCKIAKGGGGMKRN